MNESINDTYPEIMTAFREDFHWLVDRGFMALGQDMMDWRNVNVFDDPTGEGKVDIVTTVRMLPAEDVAWDSLPKDNKTYDHCLLFGKHVLFVDGRFSWENLSKWLYAYDLRGSDDDPGEHVTLERKVMVNHAGTVISAEPLLKDGEESRELGEGLYFPDTAPMRLRDFIELYSPVWERSLWKWQASRTVSGKDGDLTGKGLPAASPAGAIESMLEEAKAKEVE